MADQIIQELKIQLKGGQTVVVNFKAEKAEVLNPQVEAFLKACGDKEKQVGNFLFQGGAHCARALGGRLRGGSRELHRQRRRQEII